jgi:hypothetical protein
LWRRPPLDKRPAESYSTATLGTHLRSPVLRFRVRNRTGGGNLFFVRALLGTLRAVLSISDASPSSRSVAGIGSAVSSMTTGWQPDQARCLSPPFTLVGASSEQPPSARTEQANSSAEGLQGQTSAIQFKIPPRAERRATRVRNYPGTRARLGGLDSDVARRRVNYCRVSTVTSAEPPKGGKG